MAYWLKELACCASMRTKFESQHRQLWLWLPREPVTVLLGGIKTGGLLGLTGYQLNSIFSWIPISGEYDGYPRASNVPLWFLHLYTQAHVPPYMWVAHTYIHNRHIQINF